MRAKSLIVFVNALFALASCASHAQLQHQGVNPAPVAASPAAAAQFPLSAGGAYLTPRSVDLYRLLPPPPAAGSAQERAELDELLHLQSTRTDAEVRRGP